MNVNNELVKICRNCNILDYSEKEMNIEIRRDTKGFIKRYREELFAKIHEANCLDDKYLIYSLNETKNRLNKVSEKVFRK